MAVATAAASIVAERAIAFDLLTKRYVVLFIALLLALAFAQSTLSRNIRSDVCHTMAAEYSRVHKSVKPYRNCSICDMGATFMARERCARRAPSPCDYGTRNIKLCSCVCGHKQLTGSPREFRPCARAEKRRRRQARR